MRGMTFIVFFEIFRFSFQLKLPSSSVLSRLKRDYTFQIRFIIRLCKMSVIDKYKLTIDSPVALKTPPTLSPILQYHTEPDYVLLRQAFF